MPVNRDMLESTLKTPEYQKGLEAIGDPDDYANKTMLGLIGFFYLMTIKEKGNIEGLDAFLRQMGIVPVDNGGNIQLSCENEEALQTAFTYIIGRTSKEFFEEYLRIQKELIINQE